MICDHNHEHEKTTTCYRKHGCRCTWCESENTARLEEENPNRPKVWEGQEFMDELQFLVRNGLNVPEALKALGKDKNEVKTYLENKGRLDLVNKM